MPGERCVQIASEVPLEVPDARPPADAFMERARERAENLVNELKAYASAPREDQRTKTVSSYRDLGDALCDVANAGHTEEAFELLADTFQDARGSGALAVLSPADGDSGEHAQTVARLEAVFAEQLKRGMRREPM